MTRHATNLPTEYAQRILAVVERVRAAAAPGIDDEDAWADAEAGQARVSTGYKAGRRTASAGQYAAHALRLAAVDDIAAGARDPWTRALADAADAISSWHWITRAYGGLDLARTFDDLTPRPASVRPVVLVSAWLLNVGRGPDGLPDQLIGATAKLCAHVLDHPHTADYLRPAWYATHGPRLLGTLADRRRREHAARTRNPATTELLRTAVRGGA